MNSAQTERQSGSFGDADLEARRQRIRRGLRRANTAGAVILVIVIGLSLAALIQALRAERNARQTREASAKGEQQLWQARLAQAGAQRLSGLAGRKKEGLAAIASAAAIKPSLELRNEAIATLALTDVSDAGIWRPARVHAGELLAFSPNLDQYAVGNGARKITLHRTGTGETITSFAGPAAMTDDVTFSPEGNLIAAEFGNGDVVLWRLGEQR